MVKRLAARLGIVQSTVTYTAISILIAFIIIAALASLFSDRLALRDIAAAIVIPLVLVGPLTFYACQFAHDLDANEQAVAALARTDPLTPTFNRKYFIELAENEFALAGRYGSKLAIVLIDIDQLDQINKRHGHTAGDYVLRATSEICMAQARRTDILARYGSDEFAWLLPHTSGDGAIQFAERLRKTIAETTVTIGAQTLQFTISAGLQDWDTQSDLRTVLQSAERNVAIAKQRGGNCIFSESSEN